ncbi:MAG: acyl carrier protein [Rhizobiaceae bacterium]
MNNEIDRLTELFRDILEKPDLILVPELDGKSEEKWDSFSHINLMIAVEEEFELTFTPTEIEESRNAENLVKIMAEKGSNIHW